MSNQKLGVGGGMVGKIKARRGLAVILQRTKLPLSRGLESGVSAQTSRFLSSTHLPSLPYPTCHLASHPSRRSSCSSSTRKPP